MWVWLHIIHFRWTRYMPQLISRPAWHKKEHDAINVQSCCPIYDSFSLKHANTNITEYIVGLQMTHYSALCREGCAFRLQHKCSAHSIYLFIWEHKTYSKLLRIAYLLYSNMVHVVMAGVLYLIVGDATLKL